MSRAIEHVVDGGFCLVCGDLEVWLREHGALVTLLPERT